jgi:hypothetical protein
LILVAGKLPCLKLKFQSGTCILMVWGIGFVIRINVGLKFIP